MAKFVQVAQSGDQNVETMDDASYGDNIFYLQMEGGTILWPNSQPIQVVLNLIELFWKSENDDLTEIQI